MVGCQVLLEVSDGVNELIILVHLFDRSLDVFPQYLFFISFTYKFSNEIFILQSLNLEIGDIARRDSVFSSDISMVKFQHYSLVNNLYLL